MSQLAMKGACDNKGRLMATQADNSKIKGQNMK
jgi:hypothetical protein